MIIPVGNYVLGIEENESFENRGYKTVEIVSISNEIDTSLPFVKSQKVIVSDFDIITIEEEGKKYLIFDVSSIMGIIK